VRETYIRNAKDECIRQVIPRITAQIYIKMGTRGEVIPKVVGRIQFWFQSGCTTEYEVRNQIRSFDFLILN
jgi:hypothetical protein